MATPAWRCASPLCVPRSSSGPPAPRMFWVSFALPGFSVMDNVDSNASRVFRGQNLAVGNCTWTDVGCVRFGRGEGTQDQGIDFCGSEAVSVSRGYRGIVR